jgi:uroporphyrin-III C-methyltransferase/precorrin-2 dehydrogenase/sirohydrochlorin ferrochelatase
MRAVCAPPSEVPTCLREAEASLRRRQAGRLAPLAVLPVFLALTGRPVVVAGGDAGAAWKAELAAAAGAAVTVYAPQPSDALAALQARGVAAGRLAVVARAWAPADLAGAALAIYSATDDGEAAAFHAAARAAGAPVNVIDRPAWSTVQFGSIVNRSPVVVGISTGGAAPILAQAIRQRIETLLPPSLATWAARARDLRAEVMRRLPDKARRRAWWTRFAEAAFGRGDEPSLDDVAPAAGQVTLVGAGPGDAGLLTLNAVRAMQAADVILFDDLVSDDVLALARREARKLLVGKRGGRASCRQADINAQMIAFAKAGRRVVRLTSGDPMIFGRANEEIASLRAAGIAVDVVPGITTALALAARAGAGGAACTGFPRKALRAMRGDTNAPSNQAPALLGAARAYEMLSSGQDARQP